MRSGEHPGIPAREPLGGSRRNPTLSGPEETTGVTPGVVFVLAAGGLRHLDGAGGFLGYPPGEILWRDVLELVHEDDLSRARAVISAVIDRPGASLSTELRFRDASGSWQLMDTSVQNVLEGPEDVGLLVVNVREAAPPRAGGARSPDRGR
jgi:PAS domain-containing protein